MSQCILTITTLPNMEDVLIDWLLSYENITGFTSHHAYGHGKNHKMTLAEQVTGRRQQVVFNIALEHVFAKEVIDALKQSFSGSGCHYWLNPVLQQGSI